MIGEKVWAGRYKNWPEGEFFHRTYRTREELLNSMIRVWYPLTSKISRENQLRRIRRKGFEAKRVTIVEGWED